ncbi:MAG: dienelactone hydrolase family protein [Clostridia bacterium]|nr:dienelactone hydrolase family protein [Clostridia bacterium]
MYTKRIFSNPHGQSFHYLHYAPAEVSEPLPLIVFLHGYGECGPADGSDVDRVAKHGYFKYIAQDKDYPCIMVAPQCPKGKYWGSFVESLNRFLDAMLAENKVDPNRVYLTGLSMGGTGTWLWSLDNPDRFAAIAPICGEGISWYGVNLAKLPCRIFHGDCDDSVSPHASLAMVEKINRNGGRAELIILPGVKHNAWDRAYDDDLIAWFMRHSR